jgi:hypothetical protein
MSTRSGITAAFDFTISGNNSTQIVDVNSNCNDVATLTFTTAGGSVSVFLNRVSGGFQYLNALMLEVEQ